MDLTEHLKIKKDVCEYRPRGKSTLVEAVTLITSAIAYCRRQKIGKLLVDARGLDDVPIPTLVDRFLMVEEWAEVAESLVVGALVVHEEYIHPGNLGCSSPPNSVWKSTYSRPKPKP